MWLETLRARGIDARLLDAGRTLQLRKDETIVSWEIRRLRRTPRPSEVQPMASDRALWLPDVTDSVRQRLVRWDMSWVTDTGDVHLHAPWGLIAGHAPGKAGPDDRAETVTKLSPGALASLQFLLEHPVMTDQHRIAAAVGLSQPRVSQVLKELGAAGLVGRGRSGWSVSRPEAGLDTLIAAVAPPDLTVNWYGLDPPQQQIARIRDQARAEQAEVRLCGDWAADLLAPWRRPGLIVFHVDRTLDLDDVGFVPASPETRSVALHIGPIRPDWRADENLTAAMIVGAASGPVAPVTEIAREILATGGSDADQAAAELTAKWLRVRAATGSGQSA